jgi:hypothetical protein
MQNRRERRQMEKQFGFHKIEKQMTFEQREAIKARKKEYVKQTYLQNIQEAENQRINDEAENWSKQLASLMESGHTREQAEEILQKNKQIEEARAEKLAKREARRKA